MHLRHSFPAAAVVVALAIAAAWLSAGNPPADLPEDLAPLPSPPVPPRIASGLEYDRCLGLLTTEPETAASFARTWFARGGGEPAVHCLALSRLALGEPVPAAEELERLASASASPAATRAALLEQATQAWLMAGIAARARSTATAALALTPDDANLLIERAAAAAQLEHHAEAVDDLARALRLDPRRSDALVLRAAALRQLGRIEPALADADAALALDPDNAEALLERGILRQRQHNDPGARADWERAVALAPDGPIGDLARQNLALLEAGPSR